MFTCYLCGYVCLPRDHICYISLMLLFRFIYIIYDCARDHLHLAFSVWQAVFSFNSTPTTVTRRVGTGMLPPSCYQVAIEIRNKKKSNQTSEEQRACLNTPHNITFDEENIFWFVMFILQNFALEIVYHSIRANRLKVTNYICITLGHVHAYMSLFFWASFFLFLMSLTVTITV